MSDLRDFTQKNRKHSGVAGIKVSDDGLSASDRVNEKGRLRFNDTTDLLEYYNGSEWKSIDAPPIVTAITIDGGADVTSGAINIDTSSNITIEVKGSLFDTTGAVVTFVGGNTVSALTITRNSANLLTVTVSAQDFTAGNSPYTVKVTNGSGLSAELADAITADNAPVFTNAADTTASVFNSGVSSVSIAAADLAGATDAQGDTITYSISAGSLPSGLSINSSTGVISGSTSAVGTDTTSTFTVSAATPNATSTRQFKITVKAPVIDTYTSVAGFSYSVPTGATSVEALVIAGGGAGGHCIGGAGGAGGMVEASSYPVTPGGTVNGNVGGGGNAGGNRNTPGNQGANSVFGNITAIGGGGGMSWTGGPDTTGGGSGGGGSGIGRQIGGPGNQGPSGGGTGYGNPGYRNRSALSSGNRGGGGGGAGGGGPVNEERGTGGSSRSNSISGSSVAYAGGGGGGGHDVSGAPGGGGGAGNAGGGTGNAGTANRGSGGGGGYHPPDYSGGAGGSGVVIVKL